MMGHRQKLKSGDEWDVTSVRARKFLTFKAGARKWVKRQLSRRARQDAKRKLNT